MKWIFERLRPTPRSKAAHVIFDNLLARGATPFEQLRYATLMLDFAEQHSIRDVRAAVDQFAAWFVHLEEHPDEVEVEAMKLYGVAADLMRPFSSSRDLNVFECTVSRLLNDIRARIAHAKEIEADHG